MGKGSPAHAAAPSTAEPVRPRRAPPVGAPAAAAPWRRDRGCRSRCSARRCPAGGRPGQSAASRPRRRCRRRPSCGNHRRQRAADLAGRDTLGQLLPKGHLRQELEGAGAIGDRSPDRGEGAVGTDEPLLDTGVAPCPVADRGQHRRPGLVFWSPRTDGLEDVEQHRLDDEAVVVVPVEVGAVAVVAVADVPLRVLPERVVDAHAIPSSAELGEARLDHRREQQPVAVGGMITRVDSSAATRRARTGASSASPSAFGARTTAWARKAASTSGWQSVVKLRASGDAGSTACAIARRARSA